MDPARDSVVAGPDDARADALLEDLLDWEAPVEAERDEGTDAAHVGSGLEASLLSALDELETRVGALTGGEASTPRPAGGADEADVPTEPGQAETPAPGRPEVDGHAGGPTRPPRSLPWGTAG